METKTKIFIGLGVVAVLGVLAFATKKYWMPSSSSESQSGSLSGGKSVNAGEVTDLSKLSPEKLSAAYAAASKAGVVLAGMGRG